MLGLYDNFPENIHSIASFTFSVPSRKLQEKLVQVLYEMNSRAFNSEEIDQRGLRECAIVFETGVAESGSFNYLDEAEARKLQEVVKREPFRILDFFLSVRYYRINGEKKTPLRFDYFLVRTILKENFLEIRIFHERGPRYISPEDIGNLLGERVKRAYRGKP